jgi:hypothetical protein
LRKDLTTPDRSTDAEKWLPRAQMILWISLEMNSYLDTLKMELSKEAGMAPGRDVPDKESREAVWHFFKKHGKEMELANRITNYAQSLWQVDSTITAAFRSAPTFSSRFIKMENPALRITNLFLENISYDAAMSLLSSFQNDIAIRENHLLSFCRNKISDHAGGI